MRTIEDILKDTELKKRFIYRCLDELDFAFNGHVESGDYNKKIFDNEAYQLFLNIAKDRAKGISLAQIKKQLEKSYKTHGKQNRETIENYRLEQELENRIHTLEKEKQEALHNLELLKNNIKLLTDGKTDIKDYIEQERSRKDQEEQEKNWYRIEFAKIMTAIDNTKDEKKKRGLYLILKQLSELRPIEDIIKQTKSTIDGMRRNRLSIGGKFINLLPQNFKINDDIRFLENWLKTLEND